MVSASDLAVTAVIAATDRSDRQSDELLAGQGASLTQARHQFPIDTIG